MNEPELSPEYEAAIEAHNSALEVMNPIADAYREGTVDDETFLAAREVMKEADAAFDAAFTAERIRLEALEAEAEEAGPADPLAGHPELVLS